MATNSDGRPLPPMDSRSPLIKLPNRIPSPPRTTDPIQCGSEDITQLLVDFQQVSGQTAGLDLEVQLAEKEVRYIQAQVDGMPREVPFDCVLRQRQAALLSAQAELSRRKKKRDDMKASDSVARLAQLLGSFALSAPSDVSRLEGIEKRLDEQDRSVATLSSENKSLYKENAELRKELGDIRGDATDTRATIGSWKADLDRKLDSLTTSQQAVSSKASEFGDRLVEHTNNVRAQCKSVIQTVNERTSVLPALEAQAETLGKLDAECQKFRQDVEQSTKILEDKFSDNLETLKQHEKRIEKINDCVFGKEDGSTSIQSHITTLFNNHKAFETRLQGIEAPLSTTASSGAPPIVASETLGVIDARIRKIEEGHSELESLRTDILIDVKSKIEELVRSCSELTSELEGKIDAAAKDAALANETSARLKNDQEMSRDQINTMETRVQTLLGPTSKALKTRGRAVDSGTEDQATAVSPNTLVTVAQLDHRVMALETHIRFLTDSVNNFSTAPIVSAMCKMFNDHYGFAQIQVTTQNLIKDLHELSDRVVNTSYSVEQHQKRLDALADRRNSFNKKYTDIKLATKWAEEFKRENEGWREFQSANNSSLESLKSALADQQKTYTTLTQRLDDQDAKVLAVEKLQTEHTATVDNKLKPMEHLAELKDQVKAIDELVHTISDQLKEQAARLSSHDKSIEDAVSYDDLNTLRREIKRGKITPFVLPPTWTKSSVRFPRVGGGHRPPSPLPPSSLPSRTPPPLSTPSISENGERVNKKRKVTHSDSPQLREASPEL